MEILGEDSDQKSEYSLTQHLANNLIDMYINLPSKNHYRRPASYASKGYRTRRMAVDFAVPLITNVKIAKLLFEALVRKMPLEVSPVDFKTSHDTHTFPGLVNISAFVPDLATAGEDFAEATKASVSGGLVTSLIIPLSLEAKITDRASLDKVGGNIAGSAYCNYAMSITATSANAGTLDEELEADVRSLFVPFRYGEPDSQITATATHFASWPSEKPIVTDARGANLAPILLLADLHSKSLHVTNVQTKEDMLLISLSKGKKLKVTCDVSVYALFFSREQFQGVTCLPTLEDQQYLWDHLQSIDVFSVGRVPFELGSQLGKKASATSGIEETLPLLLGAVASGRLTLDDIRLRLHDNPLRIFALPDQGHANVEIVVGRKYQFHKRKNAWSPLEGTVVNGSVHRVQIHGQTAFLDGVLSCGPLGKDISSATISHPALERRGSISGSKPEVLTSSGRSVAEISAQMHPTSNTVLSTSVAPVHGPATSVQVFSHLLPHPAFNRRHILTVKQFGHRDVHDLFTLAHEMQLQVERNGALDILKGKVLATLFYEPSTRTSSSFDTAMKRCGGEVVNVHVDSSSVLKGETLPDTIRTLGCYADGIVIRHPDVGSSQLAAKFSPVPILNAGDGIGEHPTQVRTITTPAICNNAYDTLSGSSRRLHHPFRARNSQWTHYHHARRPQERTNRSQLGHTPVAVLRATELRLPSFPCNACKRSLCGAQGWHTCVPMRVIGGSAWRD